MRLAPLLASSLCLLIPVAAEDILLCPAGTGWELRDGSALLHAGDRRSCLASRREDLLRRHGRGRRNLPLRTWGGKQLWRDRHLHAGWRIQQHVWTGHHRLLDPRDVRRAWGGFGACRAVLEDLRVRRGIEWPEADLVLLVHGLGRSKDSLERIRRACVAAGFAAQAVNYPSTRQGIDAHAADLRDLLCRLEGPRRVHVVTHSLGGIVLRGLGQVGWPSPLEPRRLVMLCPPNHDRHLGTSLRREAWCRALLGPALSDLARVDSLPIPRLPTLVIAGGRGDGRGRNPRLAGDDDGIVTVAATRLDGARHEVHDVSHTFCMDDAGVIASVMAFLQEDAAAGAPGTAAGERCE